MSPIRIILKAAKGPSGEYTSSWTLLPARDEVHAPVEVDGTPLSVARARKERDENHENSFAGFNRMPSTAS